MMLLLLPRSECFLVFSLLAFSVFFYISVGQVVDHVHNDLKTWVRLLLLLLLLLVKASYKLGHRS